MRRRQDRITRWSSGWGGRIFPRLAATASVAWLGALGGCGSDNGTAPLGEPFLSGQVTSVVPSGSAVIVLVEQRPGVADAGEKALARVDDVTVVRLLNDQPGTYRSVSTGQWVRVWFEGAVSESYPVQGLAARVVIDSLGVGLRP